jgi:SAM-dependent methyltransferase
MSYKITNKKKIGENKGGTYWRGEDFENHQKLTLRQTSFHDFVNIFPPGIKILEAGCGLGRWAIELAKKQYDVTGIEIEQEAVDAINKNVSLPNLTIIQGDIFSMPFTSDSFDVVVSLGVLEHFEDSNIQSLAFAEHHRVLKADGTFFVTVPYYNLLRRLIHAPFLILLRAVQRLKGSSYYFSEYRYGKREFKNILNKNGFIVQKTIWDDLKSPYSFGLTTDYPLKKWLKDNSDTYKLNKLGVKIHSFLWKIYPGILSGGIGFICRKK